MLACPSVTNKALLFIFSNMNCQPRYRKQSKIMLFAMFWEKVGRITILRGVKIVPPLPVTVGHDFNLAKYSILEHGKCRIIFYFLKWVAKI